MAHRSNREVRYIGVSFYVCSVMAGPSLHNVVVCASPFNLGGLQKNYVICS